MADTGIFATTAEVSRKAGVGASSVSNTEAYINDYMTQVESMINTETRFNWSDAYSGLNVDVKGLLKLAASALAAFMVVEYDVSSYRSSGEAQFLMNALLEQYKMSIKLLKDKEVKTFMQEA
tara:strand:+ start:129 stop:494 length:366 start_codon:yes stop_codon:yes gene_type:complete